MYCTEPGCDKPVENRDLGLCATHNKERRVLSKIDLMEQATKPEIKKVSGTAAMWRAKYKVKAKMFVKGKMCAVYPKEKAVDVHHKKGRGYEAFADEWAAVNNVPLLMDERYWIPVSRRGHQRIELNPIWAKEKGFSEDRLVQRQN